MIPMIQEQHTLNYVKDDSVYILGDFDNSISQNVIPHLIDILGRKADLAEPQLNIYINSRGGDADVLNELSYFINLFKQHNILVCTHVIGKAYSCGSMLAIQGDVRTMYKYSQHLPHYGATTTHQYTPTQAERMHEWTSRHFGMVEELYTKYTKIKAKQLKKLINDDCGYLSAEECLKLGFVDVII